MMPTRCARMRCARSWRGERGFTFTEMLVALTIFGSVSLLMMHVFLAGLGHAGRSNDDAAAATLAIQVMEQIQASVNPYTAVGFTSLARSPLPLPDPYRGLTSPSASYLQVAVDVNLNNDLTLTSATVSVFRAAEATPLVTLTTVLDDQ